MGWKPYLTFKFVVVSHQFSTTPYLYHFPKQKLRNNKIWELYNEGWGFTKIHRYMKKNGYQVSKYPSSIGNIIKCRIRRGKILNQPTTVERFVDFRLEIENDYQRVSGFRVDVKRFYESNLCVIQYMGLS